MGAPLAPLAGQVLRDRTPQRHATQVCALAVLLRFLRPDDRRIIMFDSDDEL